MVRLMMNKLPEGWVTTTIGEICMLGPKSNWDDSIEVGFVPMSHAPTNFRDALRYGVRPWHEVKKAYTHFENGDVIFAKVTPCFENGKAAIASGLPNGAGAGSSEFHVLRPADSAISAGYLLATIKSAEFLNEGEESMTGAVGLRRVPRAFVESYPVRLPPEAEQKRIAQRLDALLERIDTLKIRINSIPALLKKLRQAIVAAVVADQIAIEPRSNDAHSANEKKQGEVILTELCTLITSGSRGWAANYAESGAVFIRSQDINRDMLDLSDVAYVALPESNEGKRTLVKIQDILVTITGANVGKVARVTHEIPEAYVSQHVAVIRLRDPTLAPLIEMYLKDVKTGRASLLDLAYGGGKPGLNLSNLRNLAVPVTCLRNSVEIILRAEQLFAVANQLEAKVATAKQRIDALTQSILAKAFRGELVPQDPNDEPASVLLERIRAQRAAEPKPKRGRKAASN